MKVSKYIMPHIFLLAKVYPIKCPSMGKSSEGKEHQFNHKIFHLLVTDKKWNTKMCGPIKIGKASRIFEDELHCFSRWFFDLALTLSKKPQGIEVAEGSRPNKKLSGWQVWIQIQMTSLFLHWRTMSVWNLSLGLSGTLREAGMCVEPWIMRF